MSNPDKIVNALNRAARRLEIGGVIQEGASFNLTLREQIDSVRTKEKSQINKDYEKEKIAQSLSQEFNVLDPETLKLTEAAVTQLRVEFGDDISVILLGSSTNGGKPIRRIFSGPGTTEEIDCALLTETPVHPDLAKEINKRFGELINQQTASNPSRKNLRIKICPHYNLERVQRINIHQLKTEEVVEEITIMSNEPLASKYIYYFRPSVPKEENEKNLKKFREALVEIKGINSGRISKLATEFLKMGREINTIKPKYFRNIYYPNDKTQAMLDSLNEPRVAEMQRFFDEI